MDLKPIDVAVLVKGLMRAVLKNQIELYALRAAVVESGVVSMSVLEMARAVVSERHAPALKIIDEGLEQENSVLDFLRSFEGTVQ